MESTELLQSNFSEEYTQYQSLLAKIQELRRQGIYFSNMASYQAYVKEHEPNWPFNPSREFADQFVASDFFAEDPSKRVETSKTITFDQLRKKIQEARDQGLNITNLREYKFFVREAYSKGIELPYEIGELEKLEGWTSVEDLLSQNTKQEEMLSVGDFQI